MLRMILGSPRRRHDTTQNHNSNNNDNTFTTERQPQQTQLATDAQNNNDDDTTDPESDDEDVASEPPNTPALNEIPHNDDDDLMEPWADWIRRCTHDIEQRLTNLHIPDWISLQRSRKWTWASRIANETRDKWSLKALLWDPTLDPRYSARRRQARPRRRWNDDIRQYAQQLNDSDDNGGETQLSDTSDHTWMALARDLEMWDEMEDEFVSRR